MILFKIAIKDFSDYKTFYIVAENSDLACKEIQKKYNELYNRDVIIQTIDFIAEDNRFTNLDILILAEEKTK